MKKLIIGLTLLHAFLISNALADVTKGEEIFQSKGCVMCHKKDIDTVGPSLQTIATYYLGKERDLLSYLKGQGTPIVDPSRASVMDPQLMKIRSLFENDMSSLAEYIVSTTDRPY